ncbi:MAG: hypothetical protein KQJ78_23060 [Deltaproteobacteria bacterium]|nr:hypothetical protein [Deltaproteobacteria bacterium]
MDSPRRPVCAAAAAHPLEDLARRLLAELAPHFGPDKPPRLLVRTLSGQPATGQAAVNLELPDGRLVLELRPEALAGLPPLALEGWLDLELWLGMLKTHPEMHPFNFSRAILPRFNVSGGAAAYLRSIVEYLKNALLVWQATGRLVDLGRSQAQVSHHFTQLGHPGPDPAAYHNLLAHGWQRSFFLLRKLGVLLAVSQLDRRGISQDFRSHFWEHHAYLTDPDRELLERLGELPAELAGRKFEQLLVAMFEELKQQLLAPRRGEAGRPDATPPRPLG